MLISQLNRSHKIFIANVLLVLGITFICTSVYSKPPPWAPAHGYRNKYKNKHEYRHGHDYYDHDYADIIGIFDGKCNYEKIGTIVGGATGAVIGSKVVDKDDRVVGAIAGTIIGVIIGKTVGRAIDERDRHCTAQGLEYARHGQSISWHNPKTNIDYKVTPVSSYQSGGLDCRLFTTNAKLSNGKTTSYESDACLHEDGVWRTLY